MQEGENKEISVEEGKENILDNWNDNEEKEYTDKREEFKVKLLQDLNEKNFTKYAVDTLKLFAFYDAIINSAEVERASFHKEIKKQISFIQNKIQTVLKGYKEEMSNNTVRLDFIEKKSTDNFAEIKRDLSLITNELVSLKNEVISLKKYKEDSSVCIKEMKEDKSKQETQMQNFIQKISYALKDYENKFKTIQFYINDSINEQKYKRDELEQKIEEIEKDVNEKLKEINESVIRQEKYQSNELDNFEEHIFKEQSIFTKFIQEQYDVLNANMKKLFDYLYQDVSQCKNKIKSIEDNNDQMKKKFFNNLNETEEFFNKKYESLVKMIANKDNINDINDNSVF